MLPANQILLFIVPFFLLNKHFDLSVGTLNLFVDTMKSYIQTGHIHQRGLYNCVIYCKTQYLGCVNLMNLYNLLTS